MTHYVIEFITSQYFQYLVSMALSLCVEAKANSESYF